MIKQARFPYSPLGKTFEKQIKAIEDHKKKTNRCYYKSKQKTRGFNQER